jgi:predicted permease
MESVIQDLKHSLRMFIKAPAFTLTAILALALGIGANTAIFSIVDRVLLEPMPYPEPDRFVFFMNVGPQGSGNGGSPARFNFWRQQTQFLQYASAWQFGVANYNAGDLPERIQMTQASADFFPLCGAAPLYGRTYTKEEDLPGGPKVVVLANSFWQRRFRSDPTVIGKTIVLSGISYQIIGVMRPSFVIEINDPPDVYVPYQIDPNSTEQAVMFNTGARLKPGATLAAANAQMRSATQEYRLKYPKALGDGQTFGVEPLREVLVRGFRPLAFIMLGAVGCVLLIACANVANLLLARATVRRREIAVRAALGAGRKRIVRQLLTESVVLSLIGGALGLALGYFGIRAILSLNPGTIPRIGVQGALMSLDLAVVLFTLGVSVLTGILFGLIPALQVARADLNSTIKESTGRGGTSFRHNKARSILVVTQTALALILLIGASLLVRSFVALRSVNPGYDGHNVLTVRMSLGEARFFKKESVELLIREGTERLKAMPGVVNAAATCCVPLEGGIGLPFIIEGRPLEGQAHGGARFTIISPGYFDIFKIPLLRGRVFTEQDPGGPPVVVINQAMAKQFWPNGDPLGARLTAGHGVGMGLDDPTRQIIGIVGDVRDNGLNNNPPPAMYILHSQINDGLNALLAQNVPLAWTIRTRVEPHTLIPAVQKELSQASGGLAVTPIRTMDEIMSRSTAGADFNTLVLTIFAAVALLLAMVGIYGLTSYSVAQRTQEIGIRLALGAEVGRVRNMVVFQGMRLAVVGVIIGVAGAFGLTRLIASLLYGVQARDPIVFVAIPLLLSVASLVAVWVPARRATRINPVEALRCE